MGKYTSIHTGAEIDQAVSAILTPTIKKYVAKISQAGTASPQAIVFENSIGSVVWSRESEGVYRITLAGAFTLDKTFISPVSGENYFALPVTNWSVTDRTLNYIQIEGQDGAFNTDIEIRVYP